MNYVYRHIRKDTNEIFYIGIGSDTDYKRAFSNKNRNIYWRNISCKTDYDVEIIYESEDYNFIKKKEIEFIKLYGRKDLGFGTLVNMTDGGEGVLGRIVSKEQKDKLRITTSIFFKGIPKSEEHRKKIGDSQKGREGKFGSDNPFYNKKHTKESINKIKNNKPDSSGGKNPRAIKIINTSTGIIYDCIKEAAEFLNIKQNLLSRYLSGKRKNKTSLIYYNEKNN